MKTKYSEKEVRAAIEKTMIDFNMSKNTDLIVEQVIKILKETIS